MPAQKSGPTSDMTWSRWYYVARDEMALRYGMRGAPKDRYKEQFALGKTPHEGVREMAESYDARGGSW